MASVDQKTHEGEQKTDETLNSRVNKESAELPEKHKSLLEFFNCVITSLRVLNLRKQLPTFRIICLKVEAVTGRKFTKKDLAQIKFILPEAVLTEKILLHNNHTFCMVPDIKVALNFDVVEGHRERSDFEALSKIFSSRLFELVNEHSEDFDVPEAELPEPFNQKKVTVSAPAWLVGSSIETLRNEAELLNPSHFEARSKRSSRLFELVNEHLEDFDVGSSIETLPNIAEAELLNPSHFAPSFKRRFSSGITVADPALPGQGDTSKKRVKMCLFCAGRDHYDRECKHGD